MRRRTPPLLLGTLAVLTAAGCFGTLGIVTRYAYADGMTPVTFGGWRAAVGAAVLATLIAVRAAFHGRPLVPPDVPRRELGLLVVATICGLLVNVGLFIGFGRMTVALVLLGFYTYPAMVAVAGVVLLGETLDRGRLTALGLAVLGMALVVLGGVGDGNLRIDPLGIALAIMAAAAQATFALITRRGFHSVPSEHATAFVLGGIAAAFIATSLLEGSAPSLGHPLSSLPALAPVAYAGVVTAALSTLLFVTGIRIVGALRAGIASLFEPVVGVVLAGLLLGESLTPSEALGGLLVLSAAALLQRVPEIVGPSPTREPLAAEPIAPLG